MTRLFSITFFWFIGHKNVRLAWGDVRSDEKRNSEAKVVEKSSNNRSKSQNGNVRKSRLCGDETTGKNVANDKREAHKGADRIPKDEGDDPTKFD